MSEVRTMADGAKPIKSVPPKYRTHQFFESLYQNYQAMGPEPKGGFVTGIPGNQTYELKPETAGNPGNMIVTVPSIWTYQTFGGLFYDRKTDTCYQMHHRSVRAEGIAAEAYAIPLRPRNPESSEYKKWLAHCHKTVNTLKRQKNTIH